MDLSVCLVASEFFGWGKHGGFGRVTRSLGAGLAERGVEVHVVAPKGEGQGDIERVEGMTVHGFPVHHYPFTAPLYRRCDSDVYHSQEPSWGTIIARGTMPERRHAVTCQNPRTREEWERVNRFYPLRRRAYNALFAESLGNAVRGVDGVFCQAKYIRPKVRELYGLEADPVFLPNPVEVPRGRPAKADRPTMCFLGRFDREKRPELFFELAKEFPGVRFVAAGEAHDAARDRRLRERYGGRVNLELPGFLDGDEKSSVLGESWALVNTSVSECLPVSFLEAAAHGCAILSFHDPDGFASNFGYHAPEGGLREGVRWLLEGERWRGLGERGREYVSRVHERERVLDLHLEAYEALLGAR